MNGRCWIKFPTPCRLKLRREQFLLVVRLRLPIPQTHTSLTDWLCQRQKTRSYQAHIWFQLYGTLIIYRTVTLWPSLNRQWWRPQVTACLVDKLLVTNVAITYTQGGFTLGIRSHPLVSPCMCFMEVFIFPSKVIKRVLLNVTVISRYWTHVLATLTVSESSAALRQWGSSNNSW